MGSSRLPGKVLKPLGAWKAIEIVVLRLLSSWSTESLVFAIPDSVENLPLEDALKSLGVQVFKGSENDVYKRFFDALSNRQNSFFIRITADCPFLSIDLLKRGIEQFEKGNYHIVHTGKSIAEGLDFEIVNTEAFMSLNEKNLTPIQREHPTLYFYQNKIDFKIYDLELEDNADDSNFRITLDEEEDLVLLNQVAVHFGKEILSCEWKDIKNYLNYNNDLMKINSHIERNEGLKIDSEKKDKN